MTTAVSPPVRKGPSGPLAPSVVVPPATTVVWRPDGLGDVTTFDEVMAVVAGSKFPVTIYTPQQTTYVIEPGPSDPAVVYDMNRSVISAPLGPHDNVRVQIRRNATLHNLAMIDGGVRLQSNKQVGDPPALSFAADTPGETCSFVVQRGAELHNLGNATAPMFTVPDTATMAEFYLSFNELGTAQSDAGGFQAVQAGPNSILYIVALSGGLSLDTFQPAGWIGSDATGAIGWMHDGSMAFPPNFWTGYHPGILGPNFNMALGQCGGMGPTLFRPVDQTTAGPPSVGCMYLDTDLGANAGLPIWWTGAIWVDATGAGPV
jgi:hypothetical protein